MSITQKADGENHKHTRQMTTTRTNDSIPIALPAAVNCDIMEKKKHDMIFDLEIERFPTENNSGSHTIARNQEQK